MYGKNMKTLLSTGRNRFNGDYSNIPSNCGSTAGSEEFRRAEVPNGHNNAFTIIVDTLLTPYFLSF